MKKFMITGGLMGFLIGLGVGLSQRNAWPSILWHASVSAVVLGVLMRWWGRIWFESVRQASLCASAPPSSSTTTAAPAKR